MVGHVTAVGLVSVQLALLDHPATLVCASSVNTHCVHGFVDLLHNASTHVLCSDLHSSLSKWWNM